jgi:pimeloyl-ACP methyl ester carboxylesterase
VPDLPLGAHSVPLSEAPDMSLPGLATIFGGFLDALDLRDVTLVANDTGGAITQALIGRRPPRVARLVLTSCDAFDRYPPPAVAYLKPTARVPGGRSVRRCGCAPCSDCRSRTAGRPTRRSSRGSWSRTRAPFA